MKKIIFTVIVVMVGILIYLSVSNSVTRDNLTNAIKSDVENNSFETLLRLSDYYDPTPMIHDESVNLNFDMYATVSSAYESGEEVNYVLYSIYISNLDEKYITSSDKGEIRFFCENGEYFGQKFNMRDYNDLNLLPFVISNNAIEENCTEGTSLSSIEFYFQEELIYEYDEVITFDRNAQDIVDMNVIGFTSDEYSERFYGDGLMGALIKPFAIYITIVAGVLYLLFYRKSLRDRYKD